MRKSKRPLYAIWSGMKRRCYDKKHKSYKNYGGRGIKVFQEWRDDFYAFEEYVDSTIGPRPTIKHSIDRIDNNESYAPGNLKWSTNKEQSWNRRTNIWDEERLEELEILIRNDIPLLIR